MVDHSVLDLFLNASLAVQSVIVLLLTASIVSWAIIFNKRKILKHAYKQIDKFEKRFWAMDDLGLLYKNITKNNKAIGIEKVFEAGFREYISSQKQRKLVPEAVLNSVQRSMRVAMNTEIDELETNLSFLATVGSTSPYVGLFGTVWGIMTSFQALGNVKQVTIAIVAPGISEALIATAIGLFAAIPAVIAYNRFSYDVERLINRYDNFMEEFSSILYRHSN